MTRMDEGSERKWNRWRRGRREQCAGEHDEGQRERGKDLKAEKEPPPPEGGDGGGRGGPGSQSGDLEEWKE